MLKIGGGGCFALSLSNYLFYMMYSFCLYDYKNYQFDKL